MNQNSAQCAVPEAFDEAAFRRALGQFATGVVVISVAAEGQVHAMTANAFMSGSLKPPLIVISVGIKARMHELLMQSEHYGVSILGEHQEFCSRHFAGQKSEAWQPAFQDLAGVPVLEDCGTRFSARIVHRYPCGDHTLFVGEALQMDVGEQAPLLFYSSRYDQLASKAQPHPSNRPN